MQECRSHNLQEAICTKTYLFCSGTPTVSLPSMVVDDTQGLTFGVHRRLGSNTQGDREDASLLGGWGVRQRYPSISILGVVRYKYIRRRRGRNQLSGVLTSPGDITGAVMPPGAFRMCSHGCAATVLKAANEHLIFRLELIFMC